MAKDIAKKTTRSGKKARNATIVPQASVQENVALPSVDSEQRCCMIAEAAYFIAEQRGFQGETELDDWLQAEADVDARFLADTQVSH
jgi:hypothetical protein